MGYAAAASLIVTGASAGLSFYQSSQQKKQQKEAEAEAKLAMEEAKRKLDVNFYKSLGIQKEPYELEREAVLSNMSNTLNAGVESRRGVAEIANRVNLANNVGQRNIAMDMGKEMQDLNRLVADEETSLNNQKVNLDLGTVKGAQLAAANSERLANQQMMKGFEGVTSMAGQLAAMPDLYKDQNTPEGQLAQAEFAYIDAYNKGKLDPNYKSIVTGPDGKPIPFSQALKNSGYTPEQYLEFLSNQPLQ